MYACIYIYIYVYWVTKWASGDAFSFVGMYGSADVTPKTFPAFAQEFVFSDWL